MAKQQLVRLTGAAVVAEADPNVQKIDPYNSNRVVIFHQDQIVDEPAQPEALRFVRLLHASLGGTVTARSWIWDVVTATWVPRSPLSTTSAGFGAGFAGGVSGSINILTFVQMQAVAGATTYFYWYA